MIKELFNKYKLSIIISLVIVFGGVFLITLFNKDELKMYENNYYILKYDKSWSLGKKKDNKVILKHSNDASIDIEIIQLDDNNKYSSIDELMEEFTYNLEKQNNKFNLISKTSDNMSQYNYKGYKLLYENNKEQVLVSLYKKSDKLIVFNYVANTDTFDILLDSFFNILYYFDIKEKKYEINSKIAYKLSDSITYENDDELDKLFVKKRELEIANNSYYVKYIIPSIFSMTNIDSSYNSFHYENNDGRIDIKVSILKRSIYDYIDDDGEDNVFKNNDCDKDECKDFKEEFVKLDDKKVEAYLYKQSKNMLVMHLSSEDVWSKFSDVIMLFSLNKYTTMKVEINSSSIPITKKLIDNIDIIDLKNYANYLKMDEVNGNYIFNMKRLIDYDMKKYANIEVTLNNKYIGYDYYDSNIYTKRLFGLNYEDDLMFYDYNVLYSLESNYTSIDNIIKWANSYITEGYGPYKYFTHERNVNLHGNEFLVYSGEYTEVGGILLTVDKSFKYHVEKKVLIYELESGGYLTISVTGNNKNISDSVLEEVSNIKESVLDFKG